ncbi:hypothetical protein BT96DRAFT_322860 [Gymnopus androsaceus JB14]|uniref:F-box domain-containing protein n=1 Tax=Gymnopus androsaceus JB14 TaxID=1447944 RepID=A0A6A4GYQ9_9AGAR|nr:hypothetical protein BT96DRAFT_322860 [Gymnopus androsaceus JB14]
MTRRSVRLESKQNGTDGLDESYFVALPHFRARKEKLDEDGQVQVRKRAKKRAIPPEFKNVKGPFGVLETLGKNAPLDIFFEIFTYLKPADLLQLARTSKKLRSILLSKSTKSIWRAARSNVWPRYGDSMPLLPDDMSEPQYAHLAFFRFYCHNCLGKQGSGRPLRMFWAFRMSCCRACASQLNTGSLR